MPTTAAVKTFLESVATLNKDFSDPSKGDWVGSEILLEQAASGSDIPESHLTAIRKFTREDPDTESLYTFPVLMIDTAPTRNGVIYTEASQKKSVKGWVGRTYLFNSMGTEGVWDNGADHKLQSASQVARIYAAKVVRTPKDEIGTLGWVYSVAGTPKTDEFIHLVHNGIHREVSIHVSVPEGVQCSICNDSFDKCKDNSGEYHVPRQKYKGKTAWMSTGTGQLIPIELSSVASPGSVNAHIMSDDEVANYKIVSMKEALGGNADILDTIIPSTQENTMDKVQARAALLELAKVAGVELASSLPTIVADPKNKETVTLAEVTTENLAEVFAEAIAEAAPPVVVEKCECGHAKHDGKDCTETGCEGHKPATDPKKPLFEFAGECPVCLRGPGSETAPNESELRTEMQTVINSLVQKAQTDKTALETRVTASEAKSADRDEIFGYLCESTADIAIEKGVKKTEDRTAYLENLKTLSFSGVKEIRETLKAVGGSPSQTETERLTQSMEQRLKDRISSTSVETDSDGQTKVVSRRRAAFAAT